MEIQMSAAFHDTSNKPATVTYKPSKNADYIVCPKCGEENLHYGLGFDGAPVLYTESELLHECLPEETDRESTPAETAMRNLLLGISNLPEWEQKEVAEVKEILDRLVLRYGSSAHLAMMGICIQTTINKGE
jgi:hypothetical protein